MKPIKLRNTIPNRLQMMGHCSDNLAQGNDASPLPLVAYTLRCPVQASGSHVSVTAGLPPTPTLQTMFCDGSSDRPRML